jgi:hypothetical protein
MSMDNFRDHTYTDEKESSTPKIVSAVAVLVAFGAIGAFAYTSGALQGKPIAAKSQIAATEAAPPATALPGTLPDAASTDAPIAPEQSAALPPPPAAPVEAPPPAVKEPVKEKQAASKPKAEAPVRIARNQTPAPEVQSPPPAADIAAPPSPAIEAPVEAAPEQTAAPEAAPAIVPPEAAAAPSPEQPAEAAPAEPAPSSP